MGRLERRSRRLLGLMQTSRWWNRVRIFFIFANAPIPPRKVDGLRGIRYLLTGRVQKERYGR